MNHSLITAKTNPVSPTCPDCGTVLNDGSCSSCNAAKPVSIEISRAVAKAWATVNPGDEPSADLDWAIVDACIAALDDQ